MDFTKIETCKFISPHAIDLMRLAQPHDLELVAYLLSLVVTAANEARDEQANASLSPKLT